MTREELQMISSILCREAIYKCGFGPLNLKSGDKYNITFEVNYSNGKSDYYKAIYGEVCIHTNLIGENDE